MYQIVICDDCQDELDTLKEFVKNFFTERGLAHNVVEYTSPAVLLRDLKNGVFFDLFFLDIMMPGHRRDIHRKTDTAPGCRVAHHLSDKQPRLCAAILRSQGHELHPEALPGRKADSHTAECNPFSQQEPFQSDFHPCP